MQIKVYNQCNKCINSHEKCTHQALYEKLIDLMAETDNKINAFKGLNASKPFNKSSYESYDPVKVTVRCDWYREIPKEPIKIKPERIEDDE